ncbi:LuxR family transcriptional regulator [Nonomuraea turkmeniaca]|uniref:LuxR family transcriptional regulator n=1 Tax=Nonomuraea turkmeniaca TaxID=103838 RepID=A0A5S4F5G4_9ACTN|nr:LuxR C-terminal-related transcriptional regulator [Nonomuraea turkmeniaca]TMR11478.1 LuxR family transcriptional regulator [Nonomuraea turkmeniaca]
MTVISAPAGSGKTVLVQSWIDEASINERVAWIAVGHDEHDPQRFWLSVLDALRGTIPGSALVRALTAAPDLDGWGIVERLLTDLASLADRIWLVIDDVHELGSAEARRQLELLLMRAPSALRFVLLTRQNVRLGLHRLRLEGELTEIRTADLRFALEETRKLLDGAGVSLPEPALTLLRDRTEGWVAGLRLAALSLAGHEAPERFVAEFSGSERTVAEYLLAEVLERQTGHVRELLLRTSILEKVNGELADLLTGGSGGERILQDLEQANAFVVSLDATRSWFRYHQLFTDLLRLELRRTAPGELTALHRTAAGWLAAHGHPVGAIRHSQAAQDWNLAARLLADHWPVLWLDGQAATTRDLLTGFPDDVVATDSELAALFAAEELAHGSVEAAQRHLGLAERNSTAVSAERREHARLLLGIVRLMLARRRADLPAAAEQARNLQEMAAAQNTMRPRLGEELRALALISLDSTEYWMAEFAQARRHLELSRALAQRIRRPYLEFSSLAYQAANEFFLSFEQAADHGMQAVDLAQRHGWTEEPAAGVAYMTLGAVRGWQGRLDESEAWVQRAERTLVANAQPLAGIGICLVRAMLEMARGRHVEALAAFQAAEPLSELLAGPNPMGMAMHAFRLQVLVRSGETKRAAQALADLDQHHRDRGEMRIALAMLRLTQADLRAATAALAPVLDGSASVPWPDWLEQAFLLEAIARDRLGDFGAAERALERALDLAESGGVLIWFLLQPTQDLLSRHSAHRTRHASLITEIQSLLAGRSPALARTAPQPPLEPLSDSEIRVLRYLPTNLSVPEIANELSLSPNTVKTHTRNLYRKLGINRRAEAVARARALGLLAPLAHRR